MVEGGALEKRYTRKGIVSSNLTPTALKENKNPSALDFVKILESIDE